MNPDGFPRGITRHRGRYLLRLQWQGRQVHCGVYDTLEHAKAARNVYLGEIATKTFAAPAEVKRQQRAARAAEKAQRTTLEEWSKKWLEGLENATPPRSPGTITSYCSTMRAHVLPTLGSKPLNTITAEDVQDVIDRASAGGKDSAGRNVARTLKACLNAAIKNGVGMLKKNPAAGLKVKASRRRTDEEIPTLAELREITANMPDNLKLAVELAAWCSLRAGEVLGLQRRDLRNLNTPDKATLSIDRQWLSKATPPDYAAPKEGSFRTVAIPAALVPKIKAHLDAHTGPGQTAPLFPSTQNPKRPTSYNVLQKTWNAAREPVRPVTFHSLRHFGLTQYAQLGATPTETMRRGGHRDVKAAQGYQHSSQDRDRELTALLSKAIESEDQ